MSGLEALLVVQDHDTTIDQLRHRKATLPEKARLAEIETQRRALLTRRDEVAASRDEIAERQTTAEREIAASEARIAEIDKRMYSGEVTASRDLQAMAGEIDHLRTRISGLEDAALQAMDEREPFDVEVGSLDGQLAGLESEANDLVGAIAAAEAQIDAEIEAENSARQASAASVADDLLATYEKLRSRLDGIGAARLEHGRCTGCHLTLPATELDRLKREPPDALIFCDQCGRILIRS